MLEQMTLHVKDLTWRLLFNIYSPSFISIPPPRIFTMVSITFLLFFGGGGEVATLAAPQFTILSHNFYK